MANDSGFIVTAASGRVGGRVAQALLRAGRRVRVVGRDAGHLEPLIELGAEPAVGDLRDPSFADRAFDGIDAALLVVRADRTARDFRRDFGDVGRRMATALAARRTRRAVFLSALGAHDDRHRGLILVHRDVELELDALGGLRVTHLRAPFFAENLLYFLDTMRDRGELLTPIDPDAVLDMATTAEVAALALRLLNEPASAGRVHELRSARRVTMRQIAAAISEVLGRPFPVGRSARVVDVERLVSGGGTSYDFANLMNDTWDTYSNGLSRGDPGPAAITTAAGSAAEIARTIIAPRLI